MRFVIWGRPLLLGLADPCREAWLLAGFVAETEAERGELQSLVGEIGYDPTHQPERCKQPKPVIKRLMPQQGRQARCWRETALGQLRQRGAKYGLAAYLDEVERQLLPLAAGRMDSEH